MCPFTDPERYIFLSRKVPPYILSWTPQGTKEGGRGEGGREGGRGREGGMVD